MPDIMIDVHDQQMPAYLAEPDSRRAGGVVLIHEIFGLNRSMRETADRFAKAGFLTVCPDLTWRQGNLPELEPGTDQALEEGRRRMAELTDEQMLDDVRAAVLHLREMGPCNERVATVGYCMGGRIAYLMACRGDTQANVAYYGTRIEKHLGEAVKLTRPFMMHLGADDPFIPPETRKRLVERLCPVAGVAIHTYPGVGHGFARPGATGAAAEAGKLADQRTFDFLGLYLR
ncbi:dienelactone hydrolase family protein [Skermanella rosea]|uniref:dienelactone hydrolase family protein n=1 Tax=Skermanella rosea TaxID=1817965 RepID=UPI0019314FCF|nr:dienelactone hydrolase family protein [Skermanella rosea]UEM06418.1 dienelactone hydrolase family protein [Skermanella rosea]